MKLSRGSFTSRYERPGLHQESLTPAQMQTRDLFVGRLLEERRQAIYATLADQLVEPDLVEVTPPSVSSEAGVVAKYHPHGLNGLPTG